MKWLLFVLGASFSFQFTTAQVECSSPNCTCLVPVGTFCESPIQMLSGFGTSLPTIVPGSFSQAQYVTDVDLANNAPLTLQNGSFQGLTDLTHLNLMNNQIADLLDSVFCPLVQLIYLDLSRNSLSSLNTGAFCELDNLQELNLQNNRLGAFPVADLFPLLPSLNTIYLSGNPFDCDDPKTAELYSILSLPSLNVVDSIFVSCANGTRVVDLQFDLPTSATTTSMAINPSPTISVETASVDAILSTSSLIVTDAHSNSVGTSPSLPTPIPSPVLTVPSFCTEVTSLTHTGYLLWPQSNLGEIVKAPCPNGPLEEEARRLCMTSGMWSTFIEDQLCSDGSATEQLLADISAVVVTESTSEDLSSRLASLPPGPPLSLLELDTITRLAAELVQAGSTHVLVLNNTLLLLDNLLNSSASVLTQGATLTIRIRGVIDTLLLDALSLNQTKLVLSFSHLAVGGAYLPATNNTHLLASISILMDGGVMINVGGEGGDGGDIMVEANGNSKVQVTVYDGNDLFQTQQCTNLSAAIANETVRGEVITPIISVITGTPESETDDEVVTLTYSRVPYGITEGDQYICARWNSSVNCGGGGWTRNDCTLITTPLGSFQCRCLHQGTFTLLDIPSDSVHPLQNIPLISRIIFYIFSTASIPLYLTIFIAICVTKELRSLPLMQCLINQSLSQGLSFAILAISFERDEIIGLCFALGVALQYLYLVSLCWMVVHPLLICIRIFKRLLYEKEWLIFPFGIICWVLPAVPVGVYGGLRYNSFTENNSTFICWLESALFPNTITYLSVSIIAVVIISVATGLFLLCMSDYTVEGHTYIRLFSNLPNLFLFVGVIVTQSFTAAGSSFNLNPDYVLLGISGFALLCGTYFFVSNALFKSKLRNAIFCREDPVTKNKKAGYSTDYLSRRHTPEEQSVGSGQSSVRHDEPSTNDNDYVRAYLGAQPSNNYGRELRLSPVPLSLFGQVQQGRVRRNDATTSGLNPSFMLDLSSDV